jgi:acyl-CoA reductase-like NAD-dependent aldehyde dehydrogenase
VGVKRVYVHENIKNELIENLISILKSLRPGIDYPAYITKEAKYKVLGKIEQAVDLGATLIFGGKEPQGKCDGNWLEPTIIDLKMGSNVDLVETETFGNVIPVMSFNKLEDVIKEINRSPYGLSNSIYTKDLKKAESMIDELESGMVFINEPFLATPGWDHWTGWKESGYGTASEKIMQVVKKKVWSSMSEIQKRSFWYPYK